MHICHYFYEYYKISSKFSAFIIYTNKIGLRKRICNFFALQLKLHTLGSNAQKKRVSICYKPLFEFFMCTLHTVILFFNSNIKVSIIKMFVSAIPRQDLFL